ncbi:phage shock protein A (PspA) family protein [Tahibacter aquaticus]|uniref:Phage shock protein A (PspA) family protein n=1 Tax=Tahibacter aquaticus TaxID=520092 RepID=A0A4R6Z725_9GAMM|nr:PspA/IM30 family protein [Tahibacter aquaticus]TDR47573.1 phage shock protein A (PspA) family protein [Tahibacter aquaticus]
MASINFFDRLGNLWRGFVSLWIADVEKKHPEIAYENAINSLIGKYTKLKSATAAIIRRRDEIDHRVEAERQSLAAVNRDLEAALATNQDDLALVLLQKKSAVEAELSGLAAEAEQSKVDADDAKNALLSVKSEIDKLKGERDRMLAKMQSAQARIQIQSQLDGLSVEADVQALDKVRDHIKNTISEANLGKELRDSDLDVRLDKLRQQSGSITARAQLDELKRQRAAQAAAGKQM